MNKNLIFCFSGTGNCLDLAKNIARGLGGADIVIAHTAPRGIGDLEDPAHRGFRAFLDLIDEYQPALFLHGHIHQRYEHDLPRESRRGNTRIINVSERYELEYAAPSDRNADIVRITKVRSPSEII